MTTHSPSEGIAQPATEEIKRHGDPLEKQVKDAAGNPTPLTENDPEKKAPAERGVQSRQ